MKTCVLFMAAILLFAAPAAAAAGTSFDMSLPSLKAFYAKYFDFGSAVSGKELKDEQRRAFFAGQYAVITPENELKPENVLDAAASKAAVQNGAGEGTVEVAFYSAKPILDFVKEYGLKVHGHVLFWHSQTPEVFFHQGYEASNPYVSREVMLARMDNYVRLVMEYMQENYPGVVVTWDVVNEAIDDSTGKLRQSNWTKVVGDDFVQQAFRIARKYAPEGTLLFYNDYSTPYQPKLAGILALLDGLAAENLVDGYGFQCHYQLVTPSTAQVGSAMDTVAAKGLVLRVSELDICIDGNDKAQFKLQADRYQALMKVFLRHADDIIAVETWGTSDIYSWKSGNYPLLFDGRKAAKPAFYSLTDPDILP